MLCRIRTCVAANAAQDFDRSSKSITFEFRGTECAGVEPALPEGSTD